MNTFLKLKTFDRSIIRYLIKVAKENKQYKKFTHSAALVYKKQILFVSTNSYEKTSPLTPQLIPNQLVTKHAEIGCLNWLSNNLYLYPECKFTLYITGLSKSHQNQLVQNSKPCSSCLLVIKEFPIKYLVYTHQSHIRRIKLHG